MKQKSSTSDAASGNELATASHAIFGDGGNTVPLTSGRVATLRPAKMGQLSLIVRFFENILSSVDQRQLSQLIDSIASRQREKIAAGEDPNKLSIDELTSSELVTKAFGNVSLISTLLASVFDMLPKFAAAFSDLSEDDFANCDIDDGAAIVMGIIALNYSFFSQRLPPILQAFMQTRVAQQSAQSSTSKVIPRKRR